MFGILPITGFNAATARPWRRTNHGFASKALLKKEREVGSGDKNRQVEGIDSSSMMPAEKMTNRIAFAALGAFAAYLGFCLTEAGRLPSVLPMLFALGMALTGFALIAKSGRRLTRPQARLEHAVPGRMEADAALFGHEMKNYLCTLKGNARLLRQRSQGVDGDIIDRIDRVVEKLESFTRTLSSAADATSPGVLRHLDPGDAAKACVRTHFHGAADFFRWNIGPDSTTLLGDPDRLEQVFLNLFTNAREAGAERVTTSVTRNGERLQIFIEDDGKGCAPEDLDRIFEPFFSTKCGPARRGLGMFIVQSIVENHGGSIKARSKNGNGACDGAHGLIFMLDFPLSLPAVLSSPASRAVREQPVFRSRERLTAVPGPLLQSQPL